MRSPQIAAETSAGHVVPVAGAPRVGSRLLTFLGAEGLLIVSVAAFSTGLILRLSGQVNQDAWLALLGGREVLKHGLPHHDTLTIWGHGHAWVDQQWLAQLALYGIYALGGIAGLAFAHALLTGGAYATAVVAARRLGASSRSVLLLLPACLWLQIGSTWQVRSQSLAYLPFVLVLWLLAADSRSPSRRVFLALPLLALWGNLHGSAVIGAALVGLRGLTYLLERQVLRGALLLGLAPPCLLATPYGPEVLGYYRATLFNPAFASMLTEWQPTRLSLMTAPFFALALGVAALVGRCWGRLRLFEVFALAFTCVAGLLAVRNLGWFALAALVLVPRLLDEIRPARAPRSSASRLNAGLAIVALAVVTVLLVVTLARPAAWFESRYPAAAGDIVAREAAADPSARIFADVGYGDWLLLLHPELAGRVAYDARFELLPRRRIAQVYDFALSTGHPWRAPTRGDRLLVLDPAVDTTPIREARLEPGARVLYAGPGVVVISRA